MHAPATVRCQRTGDVFRSHLCGATHVLTMSKIGLSVDGRVDLSNVRPAYHVASCRFVLVNKVASGGRAVVLGRVKGPPAFPGVYALDPPCARRLF